MDDHNSLPSNVKTSRRMSLEIKKPRWQGESDGSGGLQSGRWAGHAPGLWTREGGQGPGGLGPLRGRKWLFFFFRPPFMG